jgi:succinate dehydrogenase / fumarate reductase cytochrome b subunit
MNTLNAPVTIVSISRTTIGKKVIMALTGLIWIGFLTFHMYGNLKAFYGAEYFNTYAEGLRELGHPIFGRLHLLTVLRIIMASSFALHVWAAVSLTRKNIISRGGGYTVHKKVQADPAALTIRYGGVAILFFVLFHLMHFTWGTPGVAPSTFIQGEAYQNLVAGFQSPVAITLYLIALAALALHLYHTVWGMFQTLGLNSKRLSPSLRLLGLAVAVFIPGGFAAVPISVLTGILK